MNLSFIKLDINIMNDTKIKLIRKMPEGDSILVLWIGILCLGMKSGKPGVIEVGDGIPFSSEMLAIELDIPVNTVRLGLKAFQDFKMIEVWDDGQTYITNFEKHQELTKIEAAKEISRETSRKHREKMKTISCDTDVTVTPMSRDSTDKEEDLDLEKEKTYKEPLSDKPDETFYLTAKKKKLTGKRLEAFEEFWEAFDYKKSKASAADAWLSLPRLDNKIMASILSGAKKEADGRQVKIDSGGTPKMAQGWLTERRWEDEDLTSGGSNAHQTSYLDQCKAEQNKYQPTPQELLG